MQDLAASGSLVLLLQIRCEKSRCLLSCEWEEFGMSGIAKVTDPAAVDEVKMIAKTLAC